METEGSLPHLQKTATRPNPEPDQSSLCPISLQKGRLYYYYSTSVQRFNNCGWWVTIVSYVITSTSYVINKVMYVKQKKHCTLYETS